jgi:hypothetical protein
MIKLIIGTAREHETIDGVNFDTEDTLAERMALRSIVNTWRDSEMAKHYPRMHLFRDTEHWTGMVAYMMFETEEEAALFKLTYL